MENPLDQFKIFSLIPIKLAGYDISFTNSSLFMVIALLLTSSFFILVLKTSKDVPGKLQSLAEILYNFILDTVNSNTMGKGEKYVPFIFTIFLFILTLNLFGVIPYGFTVTSHISVTFAAAMIVFISVTLIAFFRHGMKFFSFFLPQGTPIFLAPLMILIEFFTYMTRPISLSIRLAANMMVGHILMFVIATFIAIMGLWGFLPISFIVIFTGFELFVAILQAYIFTILSCVYLNDAINLH
ncbi:MAG: F0F1 ATP synthase subunit A [Alphaproteobacteria bacterium]|nr:F0F1 ATP synthase subunit A [Alphaproteobacteria bacterium]